MGRYRERSNTSTNTTYLGLNWIQGNSYTFYNWCSAPYQESILDELHTSKRTRYGRVWRSGGPLTVKKNTFERSLSSSYNLSSGLARYTGKFCCSQRGNNPVLGSAPVDPNSLEGMGASGIAKARPGQSPFGFGQALYELHQIPTIPSLKKALQGFSGLGSQYLNVEFGWKPFLKDLYKMLDIQADLSRRLAQLRRDNGKPIRRRLTISNADNSVVTNYTDGVNRLYPILTTGFYQSGPSNVVFQSWKRQENFSRYWFSGRFRYWIPDIDTSDYALRAKARLLGLMPTPELVWQVIPWSWLIDWFSNTGDIISNWSGTAAENLVMEYGYVMGTYGNRTTYFSSAALNNGARASATDVETRLIKRRGKGSPFGFSVNLPDLTTRQSAILAALGLSYRQSRR